MSKKLMLAIATAVGIAAVATTAVSAPLPAGTKLTITKTTDAAFVGPVPGCTNGSCFGMFLFSSLYAWTPLGPGTDGGIIIGKGQLSGGQEVNGLSSLNGEVTEVWSYGNNFGTFFTAPSDAGNVFSDTSCTGSGCGSNTTPRVTDLAVWNTAWGGSNIPMGSAAGCNKTLLPACTADQVAGIFVRAWTIDAAGTVPRTYKMIYSQVVPNTFTNYPFELVLVGTVASSNVIPVVAVTPSSLTGVSEQVLSFTVAVTDPDGPAAPTCRVGTAPLNGIVKLTGCTSGTYTSDVGFVGTNTFTIIANDSVADSDPTKGGTVDVAVQPKATATYTATTAPTATYTATTAPATATYTATTAPTATYTATAAPTATYTATAAPTATYTPVIGATATYTATTGPTATYTATTKPTATYTATTVPATATYTATTAPTSTYTPTNAPTATYTPGAVTNCTDMYPVSQVTLMGKQGHLKVVVTGNITKANTNGKEIKICPSTKATYEATTNTPGATVVCKVKSNTSKGKGNVKVNDHIKCTDKPVGNDKIHVKIKSGEYKKAL